MGDWPPSLGAIKSIQRGTISLTGTNTSATATVTAVDMAKAELRFLGYTTAPDANSVFWPIYIALTNSTTITATRQGPIATGATGTVSYELLEYY